MQNLLALRFGNSLFEPLWRRGAIDHVQITVAEDLGVGGRIEFYDTSARCATWCRTTCCSSLPVAMEPPSSLHHDAVRDEKIKVLTALRRSTPRTSRAHVRGQYAAGAISGDR